MPGKERIKVQAGSLLCFWAVYELGMSMRELSRRLNISVSAVSVSVKRGEKIVNDNNISLFVKTINQKDVSEHSQDLGRQSKATLFLFLTLYYIIQFHCTYLYK